MRPLLWAVNGLALVNINEKENSSLAWAEAVRREPLDEPAGFWVWGCLESKEQRPEGNDSWEKVMPSEDV